MNLSRLPQLSWLAAALGISFTSMAVVRAGNPVFPGWYADPEAVVFDEEYWIYPTYSARYEEQDYPIYGGWSHCNIARLKPDFTGFLPFPDGTTFKPITPEHYVEGPFMFLRNGRYYFMWSEGGWTGPNYSVAYAIGDSPLGPFRRIGKVLQQDPAVATGAGHHSVLQTPGSDRWFIVYHRRPLGETDANHRVTCIDRMAFDDQGLIQPVKITFEGVGRKTLER